MQVQFFSIATEFLAGGVEDVTTAAYSWSSNNTPVATLSQTGNLHTVSVGSATGATFVQLPLQDIHSNCSPYVMKPTQGINVKIPDHLEVLSDTTQTLSCSPTVVRKIQYQVVDASNAAVQDLISVKEQFSSKSANTCNNGTPHTGETCSLVGSGSYTDTLTVSCNTVGGNCGFTYTKQQWLFCPPDGSAAYVIATPGDLVVLNQSVSVGGNTLGFTPGSCIFATGPGHC